MLKIPPQYSSLAYVKPVEWLTVFSEWKNGEAHQDCWQKHWQERGFVSWEEWREAYAKPLAPNRLKWFLYTINDPLLDLPFFYGAPTKNWSELAYDLVKTKPLQEIISAPFVAKDSKIASLSKNFPPKTKLSALLWGDKIVLIEGMHRSLALAGWDRQRPFTAKVELFLAEWKEADFPIIDGNYKNKN